MRYYPLNRVKTNLKAQTGEFLLNGRDYRGSYYETYNGEFYTGKDPIQGPSERLVKKPVPVVAPGIRPDLSDGNTTRVLSNTQTLTDYQKATGTPIQTQTFQVPQSYHPMPTSEDYARKSFMRYFAKRRNQKGYIIEVDQDTHDSLKNTDSTYDYVTYESISTMWQLVGPLNDDRTNKQYKIAGIIDTNKRLIEAKDATFPGLVAFIGGDYARFAKPTK